MLRTVTFGNRDWSLSYYAKTSSIARAWRLAGVVAAIGIALNSIICGLFGYVAYNNLRLSREIQVRIGFERRLTMLHAELGSPTGGMVSAAAVEGNGGGTDP